MTRILLLRPSTTPRLILFSGRQYEAMPSQWRSIIAANFTYARLCALVPPPRFHLLRYYGVLSAHASLRAEVVPKKAVVPPAQLPLFDESAQQSPSAKAHAEKTAEPSRHPWSWLLRRVFALDVMVCVPSVPTSRETASPRYLCTDGRRMVWVRLFCDSGKPSRYRSLDPPEMSIGDG